MHRAIRILAAAMVLAAVGLAACTYPPSPTEPPFIGGDSLTVQTAITEGALPAGWDIYSGLGWQAEHVQPGLADRVNDPARSPGKILIALGQNDGGDGLSSIDTQQLTKLATTGHASACLVWLLPHYAGTDPVHLDGIEATRRWVTAYAAAHNQDTVDWRPVALAHPEFEAADGVHLTEAGRLAYGQLIQEGVATCG